MDSTVLLWLLAGVLMLVGLAGTLLPVLPGIPLMMIGMLVAAWAEDFTRIGWVTLVILGALMGLSFVVELVAAALGARRVGASRQAIAGAALGTLVGLFFGLPGMLVGPFIGAVAGELAARPDPGGALRAGVGAWVGFIVGAVAKLAVAFAMLGVFVAALIFD
ncbi:MAG TPA: DUF456 domain-containing protein [Steroidobacteraceae bacterium]|nr:DUF456 domain-containing protein [Steroidobacteraceae bacterium]